MKLAAFALVVLVALATALASAQPGTVRWVWSSPNKRGFYSSPTSTYNTLYAGNDDGNLYSINKGSGQTIWSFNVKHEIMSTPNICRSCGKEGLIFYGDNNDGPTQGGGSLHANGLSEGYAMWRYATNGTITSRPYVYQSIVIYGSYDGYVRANDVNTGALRWAFNAGSRVAASAEVFAGKVIIGDWSGNLYALNPATGALIWKFALGAGAQITSAAVFKNPAVFVGSNNGKVYGVNIATGVEMWHAPLGGPVQGRMALHEGQLFVPCFNGQLYTVEATTGIIMSSFATNSSLVGGVSVMDRTNEIVFGDMTGTLYSMFSNGTLNWKFSTGSDGIATRPLVEEDIFVGTLGGKIFAVRAYGK